MARRMFAKKLCDALIKAKAKADLDKKLMRRFKNITSIRTNTANRNTADAAYSKRIRESYLHKKRSGQPIKPKDEAMQQSVAMIGPSFSFATMCLFYKTISRRKLTALTETIKL